MVAVCKDTNVQKCVMCLPSVIHLDEDVNFQYVHGPYFLIFINFLEQFHLFLSI